MPNPLESLKALGDQLRAQIGEELDLDALRRQEPPRPLEELLAELEARSKGEQEELERVRALGLAKVLEHVKRFHAAHGKIWTPSPLLERLAASGGGWNDAAKPQTKAA